MVSRHMDKTYRLEEDMKALEDYLNEHPLVQFSELSETESEGSGEGISRFLHDFPRIIRADRRCDHQGQYYR